MTVNPILITTCTTSGGTTIQADISAGVMGGHPGPVQVQLQMGYTLVARPPGFPSRPFLTGAAKTDSAGLSFGAGAILELDAPEANALVAAGAATILAYL